MGDGAVVRELTDRKRRGAWATPSWLVDEIVDAALPAPVVARWAAGHPLRVLDPACGDGRFLLAVERRAAAFGVAVESVGFDIDPRAVATAAARLPRANLRVADALDPAVHAGAGRYHLVVGNPPFLSQLAGATTRGGSSALGGGPYADAAVEFLALAARCVEPADGRVALVLPQSVLSSRDAAPVRRDYAERAEMVWSWWLPEPVFDAQVVTCALVFAFGTGGDGGDRREPSQHGDTWTHVVTDRQDVPALPAAVRAAPDGTLGDRARSNANFRDEYYGLVPAVGDHVGGPPFVTSGAIDPGRCRWGERPIRFAKRRFVAPRVALDRLDDRMRAWARDRLVPKVLVANQTSVIEAVCDPAGGWLPGVPVVGVYPKRGGPAAAWEIAAVLTSPAASVWAWHRQAGTGLSARSIRIGPATVRDLPWPAGPERGPALRAAVAALRRGEVERCGDLVDVAYGLSAQERSQLGGWWADRRPGARSRRRERPRGKGAVGAGGEGTVGAATPAG